MKIKDMIRQALSVVIVMLSGMQIAYAQSITVRGNVRDDVEPLMGVTVQAKGTTKAVATDLDGNYTISVPDKNAVLVFSYVGYQKQEVKVGDKTVVNVVLQGDAQLLDEVVVVGYGSVKKSDVTGAIASIRPDEMDASKSVTLDNLLQGKVAGLVVGATNTTPGAATSITIRGASSLRGDNQPLYVIDNIPQASTGEFAASAFGDDDYQTAADPLSSLNPADIESIEILKDASATAIYGSRGANGVILITTKKGKSGKPRINVNANFTVANAPRLYDMLNLRDYADSRTAQSGPDDRQFFKSGNEVRYIFSGGKYDETDPTSYRILQERDWQREIYRTAFSTDQNVSLYGNAKSVLPYRVSLGYTYDQATLKEGDNQRAYLGIILSPKFFQEHLSVNVNLKGIYNRANYPNSGAVGSAVDFDPTQSPYFYDANGNIDTSKSGGYFNWINADGSANTMASINPLSQLYDNYNVNDTWRSMGNVQLDYKIHGFEDLRVNLNLGYDLARTEGTKYSELGSILSMRNGAQDYYENYANYNANTLLEFYAIYNKDFGIHHLDVMAGYSWQHNYVKNDNIQ